MPRQREKQRTFHHISRICCDNVDDVDVLSEVKAWIAKCGVLCTTPVPGHLKVEGERTTTYHSHCDEHLYPATNKMCPYSFRFQTCTASALRAMGRSPGDGVAFLLVEQCGCHGVESNGFVKNYPRFQKENSIKYSYLSPAKALLAMTAAGIVDPRERPSEKQLENERAKQKRHGTRTRWSPRYPIFAPKSSAPRHSQQHEQSRRTNSIS